MTIDFAAAQLALSNACDGFGSRLELVGPDEWDLPTPCDGWTVRDLTGHLIGGARMSAMLLAGAEKDDALRQLFALDVTGDPKVGFQEATAAQLVAFSAPGAADAVCHHPMRDMPGSDFIWMRVRDSLIHTWDLARAIGADETLDPDLVAMVWPQVEPLASPLAASGMFGSGASENLDESATLQHRLLDTLGRRP